MVWVDPAPMPIAEPIPEQNEDNDTESDSSAIAEKEKEMLEPQLAPPNGKPNLIYYCERHEPFRLSRGYYIY